METIHQLAGDELFLTAFFIVGATFSLFSSIRLFHRARLIEDMPTSKVRSACQGYVELLGNAKCLDGPKIKAPLTGKKCVWYAFTVEERNHHGKHKWRRVEHGISDNLFLLEDETGRCVVDPEGADVTPGIRETWYGASPARAIDRLKIHPSLNYISDVFTQSVSPYRYTEERIDINDSLYVLGEFSSLGTDYRNENRNIVRDILVKLKRDKRQLAKYDLNKNGEIDQQEWSEARKYAKRESYKILSNKFLPKTVHLLKKPNTKKYQPYILAAKDEAHLARQNLIYSIFLSVLFIIFVSGIFYQLA